MSAGSFGPCATARSALPAARAAPHSVPGREVPVAVRTQLIDQGRVFCPLRKKDIDIDVCAACGSLRGIELEVPVPHVSCEVTDVSLIPLRW